MTVGGFNAGTGSVALSAGTGSILDGGDTYYRNVTAASLWLNAGTGIGSAAMPLKVTVATITAAGGSGGIYVQVERFGRGGRRHLQPGSRSSPTATTSPVTVASQQGLATVFRQG